MSYDVDFTIDTGAGNYASICDRNYTSNVSPMWAKAIGTDDTLGTLIETHSQARDLGPIVDRAAKAMRDNPDDYTPLNPANNWGDYEGAVEYLEWIAEMCAAHPNARVGVDR